jgi:hypothetical protein
MPFRATYPAVFSRIATVLVSDFSIMQKREGDLTLDFLRWYNNTSRRPDFIKDS